MPHVGVIVGCDRKQEWLLPWWWEHYSAHNAYPVVFADFGMSQKALEWCRKRGECMTLPSSEALKENKIQTVKKDRWESCYGKGIWRCRSAWFKKPLALLHSPFSIGLWLDLDCQVNGVLDPFFNCLAFGAEIGLVKEPQFIQDFEEKEGLLLSGEVNYNSGVIAFGQGASILHRWAEEAIYHSEQHPGDQHALCRAIYEYRPSLIELPSSFNWLRMMGPNPEALIFHYTGGSGKKDILQNTDPSLLLLDPNYIENLKQAEPHLFLQDSRPNAL